MIIGLVRKCNDASLGKIQISLQIDLMKVTRNTPARLIVEDRPILITVLLSIFFICTLAGAIFALIAREWMVAGFFTFFTAFVALFIYVFVRRVQVIFDRINRTITFRARNLMGYTQVIYPLDELSHAIKEGYETARCVLIFDKGMSEGQHPVTEYSTSGPAPQRLTDAINAWLKDPTPVDSKGPSA